MPLPREHGVDHIILLRIDSESQIGRRPRSGMGRFPRKANAGSGKLLQFAEEQFSTEPGRAHHQPSTRRVRKLELKPHSSHPTYSLFLLTASAAELTRELLTTLTAGPNGRSRRLNYFNVVLPVCVDRLSQAT